MKNATDWDKMLLEDLKDPESAKLFIEACLEEGVPLQTALGKVLKAQGMAKMARKAKIALPNVIRAVREDSNPTYDTLTKLLDAVGLDLSVRPKPVHVHRRKRVYQDADSARLTA
jgi:probable addiction module antidote protein